MTVSAPRHPQTRHPAMASRQIVVRRRVRFAHRLAEGLEFIVEQLDRIESWLWRWK